MSKLRIVGIGGTTKVGSTSERALAEALDASNETGAEIVAFGGEFLASLPPYSGVTDCVFALELIDAVRSADGLVIASPSYHGTISGAIKNAIDYLEETASDNRTYLDGMPVGLIVTAYGWQGACSTLATLRSMVHALRGWPTPFGAAINSSQTTSETDVLTDPMVRDRLRLVGRQVTGFFSPKPSGDRSRVRPI